MAGDSIVGSELADSLTGLEDLSSLNTLFEEEAKKEDVQKLLDYLAEQRKYSEQQGAAAEKKYEQAALNAKVSAQAISKKYKIDTEQLVSNYLSGTETNLAKAKTDLNAAIDEKKASTETMLGKYSMEDLIKQRAAETESGISKFEQTGMTSDEQMQQKYKSALSAYMGSTDQLRKEQQDKYAAAEQEQKVRADYQMGQQQEYLRGVKAQQAGIGQEAPIAALEQAAKGQAPSAAESMMRTQLDQNQKRAMAATYARGYNPAAQRAAIMAGTQASLEATGQAATLRAEEQAAARNAWAQSYQNRQAQLQQAEQFAQQQGLSVENLYQAAIQTKLQAAQTDKELQSTAILNQLGMTAEAAKIAQASQAQRNAQIFATRDAAAQAAQAARVQEQQTKLAVRGQTSDQIFAAQQAAQEQALGARTAAQGYAAGAMQGMNQNIFANQADLNAQRLQGAQQIASQRLGIAAGQTGQETGAFTGQMAQQAQAQNQIALQRLQNEAAASQQASQQAFAAKQQRDAQQNQLWNTLLGGALGAGGTIGAAFIKPAAKGA